jgi:Fe-S cluster assembly protein SufD
VSEAFLQDFEARSGTATAEAPEWLESIRRTAIDRFVATGIPTARDEEWRFTPLGPIAQTSWRAAFGSAAISREQLDPFLFGHPEWTALVFVNGAFSEALSSVGALTPGLRVGSLSEALNSGVAVIEAHLGFESLHRAQYRLHQ